MFDAFAAAGLLEPATLQLDLADGRCYDIPDRFTVDAGKLAALDGDILARLHRDDFLRPAFWIASSLGNLRHLIDRKLRKELHD